MSTKIFNGYKIKASNLDEAMDIIAVSKKKITNLYEMYLIEEEVKSAIFIFTEEIKNNNNLLDGLEIKENILNEIAIVYNQRVAEGKSDEDEVDLNSSAFSAGVNETTNTLEDKYRNKDHDQEIKIILYPAKFMIDGQYHYLFTLYVPSDKLEDVFLNSIDCVSEYGYWNNTDPLDGVSDDDWEVRGKNWDSAMPQSMPVLDGLQIQFTDAINAPYLIEESKRAVARKELCQRESMHNYYERLIDKVKFNLMYDALSVPSMNPEGDTINHSLQTTRKINNKNFNDEEAQIYTAIERKIKSIFPLEISIEDLNQPISKSLMQIKVKLEKQNLEKKLPVNAKSSLKIKV